MKDSSRRLQQIQYIYGFGMNLFSPSNSSATLSPVF
jgi:hypothetical protein